MDTTLAPLSDCSLSAVYVFLPNKNLQKLPNLNREYNIYLNVGKPSQLIPPGDNIFSQTCLHPRQLTQIYNEQMVAIIFKTSLTSSDIAHLPE